MGIIFAPSQSHQDEITITADRIAEYEGVGHGVVCCTRSHPNTQNQMRQLRQTLTTPFFQTTVYDSNFLCSQRTSGRAESISECVVFSYKHTWKDRSNITYIRYFPSFVCERNFRGTGPGRRTKLPHSCADYKTACDMSYAHGFVRMNCDKLIRHAACEGASV